MLSSIRDKLCIFAHIPTLPLRTVVVIASKPLAVLRISHMHHTRHTRQLRRLMPMLIAVASTANQITKIKRSSVQPLPWHQCQYAHRPPRGKLHPSRRLLQHEGILGRERVLPPRHQQRHQSVARRTERTTAKGELDAERVRSVLNRESKPVRLESFVHACAASS